MNINLLNALVASIATLILTVLLLGVDLSPQGTELIVVSAGQTEWLLILSAIIIVFCFQLFKKQLPLAALANLGSKLPALPSKMPAIIGSSDTTKKLLVMFGLSLILLWPFAATRSSIDLATLTLIYVMLGLGLNIVVGLAGLLDLGYVGFYAVGAYSYALLADYYQFSFWMSLPIAGLLAALFGFILGFPVLRLRGDYLAIVTLGFGEIIRILLNNWTALTGGPNGIGQIPKPTLFGLEFGRRAKEEGNIPFHEFVGIPYDSSYKVIFLYILAVLLVLATLFVINRVLRMPLGRAWEALREDEIACRSLGLNPTVIKLSAFTMGATFAGFAGAFFAARQGFISPESFTFIESAIILAIVVLGGMGSQVGVILAAIVMTVLPELAREFQEYRMLLFGLLMVLMMIWRPSGLLPMKRPKIELARL
ncbi:high-affinity branched-chain amino acid ABC transporter permease LivM [Endozoicomonas sp. SM1973]|uniref:High-affinity branched-chain amino acid ABC transporter permease LivM n=1 Tax=Spartinivicinus marinus TaxID=2994442 RepID=A0A853IEA1_9GAMM|nr:high-affinity branched-chain amino acid ABC transporter permease LivM [Spartinivicinus marinus]MCX4025697.1 high-affinity branched-chain amino acid ABC transporter permease LivM [Spartinivicinus marinus]NYZ68281.1 high-affinity branched-chain amino acid ABC transporter permease LivM [Spartinivicinus marinus]